MKKKKPHYNKQADDISSACPPELPSFFHAIDQFAVLRTFQKILYRLTGLPFDFMDLRLRHSRNLRAQQRVFTPFCRMVNNTPAGRAACERDEQPALTVCVQKQKCVLRPCHLGLIDICVPVVMNNRAVGVFCTGQLLYQRPTEKSFQKIQKRLAGMGLDMSKARRAYFLAPVIEKRRVSAIMELVKMAVELIDARRFQTLQTAVAHDSLRKALDFMENHYTEPLTLPDVAKKSGLSASRLAHIFKAQVGMTFTAYLSLIRVNWAKYYLANSRLRAGETAFQVGFNNLSHFNHIFRRITGLAPTRYRQQHASTKI